MKGQILDFSIQNSSGVITGEDGKRYSFNGSEWKEQNVPNRGMKVDFDIDENGNAIGIYKALSTGFLSNAQSSVGVSLPESSSVMSLWAYFMQAVTKRFADFQGRASKKEFWGFMLVSIGIQSFLFALAFFALYFSEGLSVVLSIPSYLFGLITFIPQLSIAIRRLHDIGKPGWWFLVILVPLLGFIALIVFWLQKGQEEANQWGEPVA